MSAPRTQRHQHECGRATETGVAIPRDGHLQSDRADRADYAHHADRAQLGLTRHFGGVLPGSLRSRSSLGTLSFGPRSFAPAQLVTFDYWWLAHAVEARVDAYERSGCPAWLALARNTYTGIRRRNRGSLFNNYFDDMSWLAIAALRLFDATAERRYLDDASALLGHIVEHGFSERFGPSIAWRKQQPDYKNAPTNGAFAIAAARLAERTHSPVFRTFALAALEFLNTALRDQATALITDGINRRGDGRRDDDWLFSYNQGLYLGACLEVFALGEQAGHLADALRTGAAAVERLAPQGVFAGENVDARRRGGGDIGLFKGIFYRYAQALVCSPDVRAGIHLDPALDAAPDAHLDPARDPAPDPDRLTLERFLVSSTDRLYSTFEPSLLAHDDWRQFATGSTALSTQLSAVLALEARARYEAAASRWPAAAAG